MLEEKIKYNSYFPEVDLIEYHFKNYSFVTCQSNIDVVNYQEYFNRMDLNIDEELLIDLNDNSSSSLLLKRSIVNEFAKKQFYSQNLQD